MEMIQMPKKTQNFKKPIIGVAASVAIFLVVAFTLNLTLKWPTSVLTLGTMLVLAWRSGFSTALLVPRCLTLRCR